MQLTAQIAAEQDPATFHALIVKLNDMLEEKDSLLQARGTPPKKPD